MKNIMLLCAFSLFALPAVAEIVDYETDQSLEILESQNEDCSSSRPPLGTCFPVSQSGFVQPGHNCPNGTVLLYTSPCGSNGARLYKCYKCMKDTDPKSPSLLENCTTTPFQHSYTCVGTFQGQTGYEPKCPQEQPQ